MYISPFEDIRRRVVVLLSDSIRREWVKTLTEERVGSLVARVRRGRSRSWLEVVGEDGSIVRVFGEGVGRLESSGFVFVSDKELELRRADVGSFR